MNGESNNLLLTMSHKLKYRRAKMLKNKLKLMFFSLFNLK